MTDEIVQKIIELAANNPKLTQREIAALFHIDRTLVGQILRRKTAARVNISPALRKKAQKRLKDSPKRTPTKIADRVRSEFAAGQFSGSRSIQHNASGHRQ